MSSSSDRSYECDTVIWIVIIDIKGLSQGFEDIN